MLFLTLQRQHSYGSLSNLQGLELPSTDHDPQRHRPPTGTDHQQHSHAAASPLHSKSTTTVWQTFVHLLKGYIGPGCLSLPWAMSQLGLPLSCVVIAVVSFWTSYNCWNVVRLKRHVMQQLLEEREQEEQGQQAGQDDVIEPDSAQLHSRQQQQYSFAHHDLQHLTYPDVAEWAYGTKFRRLTATSICVQQLAVCTVFLSFIGENVAAVMEATNGHKPSHALVITLALPLAMVLSCLPNLKVLAPVMVVATLTLMTGFGLLGVVVYQEWEHRPSHVNYWEIQLAQVPLAVTAILYSYEGICLILPVESAMEEPQHFAPVFVAAMTITAAVFAGVAAVCVVCFGDVTSGSITAFLVETLQDENVKGWLYMANTACSVAVLLTYPLQLFPSFELVGPWLSHNMRWDFDTHTIEYPHPRHQQHSRARWPRTFASVSSCDNPDDEHAGNHDHHQQNTCTQPSREDNCSIINGHDDNADTINIDDDDDDDDNDIYSRSYLPDWATFNTAGDSPQLRAMLVCFTYIMAIAVPNVQLLVSLAGALSGSATGLIIPPLLELEYLRRQEQQRQAQREQRQLVSQHSSGSSSSFNVEDDDEHDPRRDDEESIVGGGRNLSMTTNMTQTRMRLKRCECFLLCGLGNVVMVFGTGAALWDIIRVYQGHP